ncbi:hypothetical protein ACX84U_27500, partial [Burkholderia pseudomallei]
AAAPAAPAADDADAKKRAIIAAALERARKKKEALAAQGAGPKNTEGVKKEALAAQGAGPKNTEGVSAAVQAQIDAAEARRRRLAEQRDAADEPGRPDDANAAGDDASPPSKTKQ